MAGSPIPSWSIVGVVTEVRDLKAKNGGAVFAHLVKIAAMGGTFEVQTRDVAVVKPLAAGIQVQASGTFESYNGQIKLALAKIAEIKA